MTSPPAQSCDQLNYFIAFHKHATLWGHDHHRRCGATLLYIRLWSPFWHYHKCWPLNWPGDPRLDTSLAVNAEKRTSRRRNFPFMGQTTTGDDRTAFGHVCATEIWDFRGEVFFAEFKEDSPSKGDLETNCWISKHIKKKTKINCSTFNDRKFYRRAKSTPANQPRRSAIVP